MSFTIRTNSVSAFATRGLQERNAHDRRDENRPHRFAHRQGLRFDACDLTHSDKASAAIRQAGDFQARLNESFSFLQTQEFALGQLEGLCTNAPESENLLDIVHSLTEEKFNGLDLFSHDGQDQPFYVQAPEGQGDVCIHRPLMSADSSVVGLRQAVLAAREENHREQAKLREISKSTVKPLLETESAKETILQSQKCVLADASTALSVQANSAHEAVLRLFS